VKRGHEWEDDIEMLLLKNCVGGCGLVSCGSGSQPVKGFSEHSNKCSGSLQDRDFFM
jgi:hypothetical protein